MQQVEVAMVCMHACATELDRFLAQWLVGQKVKLTLAVVTDVRGGALASLQAIRPDDFPGRDLLDNQMVANFIESVCVQPGEMRFGQAFVEFKVENVKPQPLRSANFVRAACQPYEIGRTPRERCGRAPLVDQDH